MSPVTLILNVVASLVVGPVLCGVLFCRLLSVTHGWSVVLVFAWIATALAVFVHVFVETVQRYAETNPES